MPMMYMHVCMCVCMYTYSRSLINLTLHISIVNCNNETVDFAKFEDVSLAFLALFRRFQEEVKSYEIFLVIKYACVAYANQKLSKEIKRTQDINSLFQLLAENKPHCNWLNIRILEVIATASGNSKLTGLICDYKKTICSKTLREVWGHVPYQTVRTKYYSTLQAKFNGKDPDNMTVEQLKKMCECYLVEDIAMLISVKEENGLKITWLIPTNSVYHVYLSVLMLPQESRPDSSLQISDWIVHRPLHILQHLHGRYCECKFYLLCECIDFLLCRVDFTFYSTNRVLSQFINERY